MNMQLKMLTIAAIIAAVSVGPTLSIVQMAQAQGVGSTYCQSHTSKSQDWRDGCESGAADCSGGKPYNTGKGHTVDFVKGYDAGWSNKGCKMP
jgi:hypothetical protein